MARQAKRFLVLGSGELGAAILHTLIPRATEQNTSVDILVRRKASVPVRLVELGGRPVEGDIVTKSEAQLAEFFAGYDTVISCVGFSAGSGTQLKIARAVIQGSVSHFIPWQFGVDYDAIGRGSPQPLFDEQLDVRDLLRGQTSTRWTIVSTGLFLTFLFEPAFGVVDLERGVVRALGGWDNAVTVTTPGDIGVLTTEIVFAELVNQVVYIAGDTITYGDLAYLVQDSLNRPVHREELTFPLLKSALAEAPDDVMCRYRAVFALRHGLAWDKESSFNFQKGIATTDVASWLRANVAKRR